MSTKAQVVLEEFTSLAHDYQLTVYQVIARTVAPEDYGPLSDDELTAIASETFALLDEEESSARPQ